MLAVDIKIIITRTSQQLHVNIYIF